MAFWRQFHANGPNSGFVPVSSRPARTVKWRTEVGPVGYGSPVIGPDDTIYIGTLDDRLVAVAPDGTIRWQRKLAPGRSRSVVTGSPAIDAAGNVYVITTKSSLAADHRAGSSGQRRLEVQSSLHSFDSSGDARWVFRFPTTNLRNRPGGFALSSPKIFNGRDETFIFAPLRFGASDFSLSMLVIDQSGQLVHQQEVVDYPPSAITGQSHIGEFFQGIAAILSIPFTGFDTSGVPHRPLQETFGWAEPTVAIADYPPHENRPIIVVEDGYKTLATFRWQNRRLNKLWAKTDRARRRSSPAVFPNEVIALGQEDGTLALYNLTSGDEYGKPWYKARGPIYSPSVSFGRQMFVVAEEPPSSDGGKSRVLLLESDSKLLNSQRLSISLSAPALSANHLYISSLDGFYTYNFDLESRVRDARFSGGVSSPAIADDGTVYAIDQDGVLWAWG